MSYLDRLKAVNSETRHPSELTKLTKGASVGFVSGQGEPFSEIEPLTDPAAEGRRQAVLKILAANPEVRYAIKTDDKCIPHVVLLTLAVRGRATCELYIPQEKYDPFLLLSLIDRHGSTVH